MTRQNKLPGFSIVKFLIFVAMAALLYFFAWPLVRNQIQKSGYDKANDTAKIIYDYADEYCKSGKFNQYHLKPESVICAKVSAMNGSMPAANLQQHINIKIGAGKDRTYFTIIIDEYGKVKRVFWSRTNDGSDIIGAYPKPFDAGSPESTSFADLGVK